MTAAIELTGVGKRYQQTARSDTTLLHRLARIGRSNGNREIWALRDVDLVVDQGETVGVIGRNGSGKTTLLRMLSGVSAPSVGRVHVAGRVAPLIGIGVGFNQELTGRENVFVNGRLLGMSPAQLRRRFDDIVAFSEIEQFIDSPVKFYSSGMFLRLAFSVAIHAEPDVFLLDEILAVGDVAFQLKCMERMREIQAAGTTVVIVTHNLHTLDRTASRSVLLSRGQKLYDGPTEQAIARLHQIMQSETRDRGNRAELLLQEGTETTFVGGVDVSLDLFDGDGRRQRAFSTGDRLVAHVQASFEEPVEAPILGVMVAPVGLGVPAYMTHTGADTYAGRHGPGKPLEAEVSLDLRLLGGAYSITIGVYDSSGKVMLGTTPAESFYVSSAGLSAAGLVDLDASVTVEGRELPRPRPERLSDGTT